MLSKSSPIETDFDRSLRTVARTLPNEPLPPALRGQVLNRLPERGNKLFSDESRARAIAMGIVLAILGIFAWLFTPLILSLLSDPAAEAMEAVRDANTWHISGWEIQHKQKVAWEVWGRKAPFFYYERLGDKITYDNGHERVQIIPPGSYRLRMQGIVVKTVSQPENRGTDWVASARIGKSAVGKPSDSTAQDLIYLNFDSGADFLGTDLFGSGPGIVTRNLYFVDKRSHKFTRIQEWMSMNDKEPRTLVEDAAVELDKPIPQDISAPAAPAGYSVFDATAPPIAQGMPKENTQTAGGLTAQVTPVAMDSAGDVLLRVRGWLGNTLLTRSTPVTLDAEMPGALQLLPRGRWPYYDGLKRDYVLVRWPSPGSFPGPTGDAYMLFAPAEPLRRGESLPKSLTVSLSISAMLYYPLLSRDMTWTVSLPAPTQVAEFDQYWNEVDPNWRWHWLGSSQATFPSAVDDGRAMYWGWQSGPSRTDRAALLQGLKWREKSVEDSLPASNQAQFYRLQLGNDYDWLREYDKSRETYQEVIAISRRYPKTWRYYRSQAEGSLSFIAQKKGRFAFY